MRSLMLMAVVGMLAACADADKEYADEAAATEQTDMVNDTGEERGGETYQEFDTRRNSYAGSYGSFAGDGCTQDCSGHDAGYNWAMENSIDDPDNCGGNSWSFEEGCRAYAEEQSGDGY